jgi:PAS domain S-box-containing protein
MPSIGSGEAESRPLLVLPAGAEPPEIAAAAAILRDLAGVFLRGSPLTSTENDPFGTAPSSAPAADARPESVDAVYRALVEQIPAVVFMANLDRGIGQAYVSPQIEAALGFSQQEWLEDPVRWFHQIHEDDKQRWSLEAANMFLTGNPLRSAYRVMARDGRMVWLHCEAKMVRRDDGSPWLIHGAAFDITDVKQAEQALQEERNVVSAILDTVGALVVVLDPEGRIVRFNRACERTTGYEFEEVQGRHVSELFRVPEELAHFETIVEQARTALGRRDYEARLETKSGGQRTIAWSSTALRSANGTPEYIIVTGIDVTERKRLERATLEISSREQRRIGQDLHDGLGQHLTGIAFMSKVLQQRLEEQSLPESAEASKIVRLVNEAIHATRELARGLVPVVSDEAGLMSALKKWAGEVNNLYGVACSFECRTPVPIRDVDAATHLLHIVQEAVNNALRHGHPRSIVIRLTAMGSQGHVSVEDDGDGARPSATHHGMGLHIMSYRASMIGGSLDLRERAGGGTVVSCTFPMKGLE